MKLRAPEGALIVAHCAGMLDLVALPVWMGAALIGSLQLDPQQAGLLVTLFLGGQVVANLLLAPRFGRLSPRLLMTVGFALATLAFIGVFAANTYVLMALLHLLGGVGAGTALSCTHGLMGRSQNPHRLFALAGLALGLFGILVLGSGPVIVAKMGGAFLFLLFAFACLVAALASWMLLDKPAGNSGLAAAAPASTRLYAPLGRPVWLAMLGIGCMSLANAMLFSFVERIGMDRGYGLSVVTSVLIAVGLFNLLPPLLAALLEKRLPRLRVLLAGPVCQMLLALLMTSFDALPVFAVTATVWVGIMIFTHTFVFGLLAELDPSGRATAATPSMLMVGSAIGPVLAGSLVKISGYEGLGIAVVLVALLSLVCFVLLQGAVRQRAEMLASPGSL